MIRIQYPFYSLLIACYTASVLLFSYSEGKTIVTKFAGIAIALAYIYTLISNNKRILVPREFYFLAVWFVIALLSSLLAIDQQIAFSKIATLLQIMPLALMLFGLQVWTKSTIIVWATITIVTCIISVLTYINPFQYSVMGRLTGTLGNANIYGLVLVISIAFSAWILISTKSNILRLIIIVIVPFMFYMLLETGSRKAMVGVVLVLVLLSLSQIKIGFKKNFALGVGVMIIGVVVISAGLYYMSQSTYYNRMESLFKAAESNDVSKVEESAKGRLDFYKLGIKATLDNPILGVGVDNFRSIKREGLIGDNVGTYSHSNYLEILTNTGLLGFLLYYSIYISIYFRLFRLRKIIINIRDQQYYTVIFALFIMFTVYDFAMVSYSEKVSWLVLSTILASIYLLNDKCLNKTRDLNNQVERDSVSAIDEMSGHCSVTLKPIVYQPNKNKYLK